MLIFSAFGAEHFLNMESLSDSPQLSSNDHSDRGLADGLFASSCINEIIIFCIGADGVIVEYLQVTFGIHLTMAPDRYMSGKFESYERINSMRETHRSIDLCYPCTYKAGYQSFTN